MRSNTNNFLLHYFHTQHPEPEEGRKEEASSELRIPYTPITIILYLKGSVTLQLNRIVEEGPPSVRWVVELDYPELFLQV